MRQWREMQPHDCSRAWDASLGHLSHRLHCTSELFYIILFSSASLCSFQNNDSSSCSCSLYVSGLPGFLSQLVRIHLHTFTSQHQPIHTYETGRATGWINTESVITHTPTPAHTHNRPTPLTPTKAKFQCYETPTSATWTNVFNRKSRPTTGTGNASGPLVLVCYIRISLFIQFCL